MTIGDWGALALGVVLSFLTHCKGDVQTKKEV